MQERVFVRGEVRLGARRLAGAASRRSISASIAGGCVFIFRICQATAGATASSSAPSHQFSMTKITEKVMEGKETPAPSH